jgi:hypothetical protein
MTTHTPVVWVHGDALTPTHPALHAYPDAPALFVWDDDLLKRYNISLKRILFMYECLLEMPVTIRRGDVAAEVLAFAAQYEATLIATQPSPAPRFEAIRTQLEQHLPVELHHADGLTPPQKDFPLKRFSRYWRKAEPYATRSTSP